MAERIRQKVPKMAGKFFIPKICTVGFLRMLITNLNLKLKNSKWRIQYGGRKCKKRLHLNKSWYSWVIYVAYHESELKPQEFEVRNKYGE